jgi:hypothetical protein
MKRFAWGGWLIAALVVGHSAATSLAQPAPNCPTPVTQYAISAECIRALQHPASTSTNPLEGSLLLHSDGALYLYHAGLKYAMYRADVGDRVIEAIATASTEQWDALFGSPTEPARQPLNIQEPSPGYS